MDTRKEIDSILEKTAQKLTSIIDVNTVIGKPVYSESGSEIIPFTKVTLAYLSGGGEYGEIKSLDGEDCMPYAGGVGTVINIKPTGFLIDDGKRCRIVKVTDDPIDNLIEKAGDLLTKYSKEQAE